MERKEFNNFQTVRIAGSPDIDLAKNIIENKLSFFGLTDRFNESLILFKKTFNSKFSIFYELRNNLEEKPIIFDELSSSHKQRIIDNNRQDLELYNFAKQLFDKRIEGQLKDINKLREEFEKKNLIYKAPKVKSNLIKLVKGIQRYLIEPLVSK